MAKMEPKDQDLAFNAFARGIRGPLLILFLTTIILSIVAGYGYTRFGSLRATLSALDGKPLVVDKARKSILGVRPGARLNLHYALANTSEHPIRLVGASSSCSCTVIEGVPMTIAASETKRACEKLYLIMAKAF